MKVYECVVDDGVSIFKTTVAAKSKKELLNVYGGNGNFVKITNITKQFLEKLSIEILAKNIADLGYGEGTVSLVRALLEQQIDAIAKKGDTKHA